MPKNKTAANTQKISGKASQAASILWAGAAGAGAGEDVAVLRAAGFESRLTVVRRVPPKLSPCWLVSSAVAVPGCTPLERAVLPTVWVGTVCGFCVVVCCPVAGAMLSAITTIVRHQGIIRSI